MANGFPSYTPDFLQDAFKELLTPRIAERNEFNLKDSIYDKYRQAAQEGRLTSQQIRDFAGAGENYEISYRPQGGGRYTTRTVEQYLDDVLSMSSYKGKYDYSKNVNPFDQQSFIRAIEEAQGIPKGDAGTASMFTAFTPEMFRKLDPGYYQEEIQEGRGSLLDTLTGNVAKAKSLGGNLAGYGRRQEQEDVAKQSYLGGMENVYAGVDEQRAGALQNIYDVLSQYRTIGDMG